MDTCRNDLKGKDYGLRMNELIINFLLYADVQVLLASQDVELQKMVNIMCETLGRKEIHFNVSKTMLWCLKKTIM